MHGLWMCAPVHAFKVQAVYQFALAFTFFLYRNSNLNSEILLVDKLGSSPLSLILAHSLSTVHLMQGLTCIQPSRTPRICQSFKPHMVVSFSRAPFYVFGWGLICPNQYSRLRQLWCLFANDPYCFRQCCRLGAFRWSSKSGQLPLMAVSVSPELQCHRL